MLLAEVDYPLLNIFWTTLIVFGWILWFWLLFRVYSDLFRRRDIGGGAKTGWVVLTLLLPFLGVFIYLIAQGRTMAERDDREAYRQRMATESYIRSVAGSTDGGTDGSDQITTAKGLLDSGVISQEEFDQMVQKVHG